MELSVDGSDQSWEEAQQPTASWSGGGRAGRDWDGGDRLLSLRIPGHGEVGCWGGRACSVGGAPVRGTVGGWVSQLGIPRSGRSKGISFQLVGRRQNFPLL